MEARIVNLMSMNVCKPRCVEMEPAEILQGHLPANAMCSAREGGINWCLTCYFSHAYVGLRVNCSTYFNILRGDRWNVNTTRGFTYVKANFNNFLSLVSRK